MQDIVHDGDNVGQTLPRPRARGQHVIVPRLGGPDGIGLMLVEAHGRPDRVFLALARPENLSALLMKELVIHQILHVPAPGKGRIELGQRVRPEQAAAEFGRDLVVDTLITDFDEALDVGGVIVDDAVAEIEDIHGRVGMVFGVDAKGEMIFLHRCQQEGCREDHEIVRKLLLSTSKFK